jgi:Major Facilitator Superfamily
VTVRVRSTSCTVLADPAAEQKHTQTAADSPLRDCRTRRQRPQFPARFRPVTPRALPRLLPSSRRQAYPARIPRLRAPGTTVRSELSAGFLNGEGRGSTALARAVQPRSTVLLGIVLACYGVPRTVFIPVGGILSDKSGPRTLMLFADVMRCVLVGVLTFLAARHTASLITLGPTAALIGAGEGLFLPASHTLLPDSGSLPGGRDPGRQLPARIPRLRTPGETQRA